MKMYASLHTALPNSQSHEEIQYHGYKRIEIDYDKYFGQKALTISFPRIELTDPGVIITHFCVGENESGEGRVAQVIELIPHIPMVSYTQPRVIVANIPEPLPEQLNPIARVVWNLVNERKLAPEDLHPAIFEAVNDAFSAVGMPVMRVIREGSAKMDAKMSELKSMQMLGSA